jgi:16S rRNA (guanine527-N7)-methyltransferase
VDLLEPDKVQRAFSEAGIGNLPANAFDQFSKYLELLLRWNQRLNLTAIREPDQIIQRHFIECVFAGRHLPPGIESLLDYGSGAGFPGIPVAISRPEIRVTLAESQTKKASFLQEAVRALDLKAEVYAGRVEAMPVSRQFDAVAMRAVEKMELAIPIAVRRAKEYLVLLTTEKAAHAFQELAPELDWLEPVALPKSEQIVLILGRRV